MDEIYILYVRKPDGSNENVMEVFRDYDVAINYMYAIAYVNAMFSETRDDDIKEIVACWSRKSCQITLGKTEYHVHTKILL